MLLMGKHTIFLVIFNSYISHYQRVHQDTIVHGVIVGGYTIIYLYIPKLLTAEIRDDPEKARP